MPEFYWLLHGPPSVEGRRTEVFDSKEAAESWLGAEWRSLRDEAVDEVSLIGDDETLYRMSLHEA